MIRVLHIIERLVGWGGTPRKLLHLARHTDATRFSSTILTFAGRADLDARFEACGWTVENGTFGRFSGAFLGRILRIVRTSSIDVICTHFKRPLAYGSLASRLTRVPFVHFEHSSPFLGAGNPAKRLAARVALRGCTAVVANSRYTAAKCVEFYDPAAPIAALPNPVAVESPPRDDEEIGEVRRRFAGRFVCAAVGGFVGWRDHATLLGAMERMEREGSGPPVSLLVIGGGPGRQAFEAEARRRGLEHAVLCLGYRTPAYGFFDLAGCLVSAAVDEGFGIAVAEAMLCGLPVVLADSGAYPELIDAESGILFPPRDAGALAAAIRRLADNPPAAESMGAAGRARAEGMCDPRLYAERIGSVLSRTALGDEFAPGIQAVGWPESLPGEEPRR